MNRFFKFITGLDPWIAVAIAFFLMAGITALSYKELQTQRAITEAIKRECIQPKATP